jgi:putative redox protein
MANPSTVHIAHKQGDLFEIAVRHHVLHADQPVDAGGADTAPTPTELFVASLASCVAYYARRFLERHELPYAGLSVVGEWHMGIRPSRVSTVKLSIATPAGIPQATQKALLAVASHCTVQNSLEHPPEVTIALA